METEARRCFARIDALGGMVRAVEAGLPQREIAECAFTQQVALDAGERRVVGLNVFCEDDTETAISVFQPGECAGATQAERFACLRRRRDAGRVSAALDRIRAAARTSDVNLMPPILDAVRVDATLGEVSAALADVWGTFTPAALL